jgi:hypothetical protein
MMCSVLSVVAIGQSCVISVPAVVTAAIKNPGSGNYCQQQELVLVVLALLCS